MVKREMFNFIALAIVSVLLLTSAYSEIPNYADKYVNDFAGVFNALQVNDLRILFYAIDINTTAEVVFVSDSECTSKGGQSQYATELLSGWKVGKADKNNGMVILYCQEENKIWVSVGYGLEGILPDSKIGRMLDETYVPLRDSGNVTEGIISFAQQIAIVLEQNKEEIKSGQTSGNYVSEENIWVTLLVLFIIFRIISRIIGQIFKKKYKSKKRSSWPWFVPFFIPSGSSHGGGFSGGGGFGGGGFGGGMGGGGGAGR